MGMHLEEHTCSAEPSSLETKALADTLVAALGEILSKGSRRNGDTVNVYSELLSSGTVCYAPVNN